MKDERNYHIFYCMLAGMTAEDKRKLDLKNATDYFYLIQVRCNRLVDDMLMSILLGTTYSSNYSSEMSQLTGTLQTKFLPRKTLECDFTV